MSGHRDPAAEGALAAAVDERVAPLLLALKEIAEGYASTLGSARSRARQALEEYARAGGDK